MSFPLSAGTYPRIKDESFLAGGSGIVAGAIVISAKRGPTEPTVVTSPKQFIARYGLPSRDNPSMYCALRFLSRATVLTVNRVINDAIVAEGALMAGTEEHLSVTADNPGAWGNKISVKFGSVVGAPDGYFAVVVEEDGEERERFEVSRDPDAKDGYGSTIFIEDVINNQSNFIRVVDNSAVTADYDLTSVVTLSGGTDDTIAPTSAQIIMAFNEFKNENEVDAQLLINGGWAVEEIQLAMHEVASARTDCFPIFDVPKDTNTDVTAMIDYRDLLGINDKLGALYGGWPKIYDQFNDREIEIPPSGDVAAAFVQTFSQGERWEAVAGLQFGIIPNAMGVSKVFNEGERDLLYTNGINPITTFAGANAIIWGQKTLQIQRSALDRVNVVNNVLWITGVLKDALQPFVFRPNTQYVRDNINFILSQFLESVQTQGGLYGFHVDTSTEINTPQVIDSNQLIVNCYIKPTRVAEFIRLNVIVSPTGVELA